MHSVYCEYSVQSVALLYISTKTLSISYNTVLRADQSTTYIYYFNLSTEPQTHVSQCLLDSSPEMSQSHFKLTLSKSKQHPKPVSQSTLCQ